MACESRSGTLDQLDGNHLTPTGPQWPRDSCRSVLELVVNALEESPELLETQVWAHAEHLDQPLSELRLTTRAKNCLRRSQLHWVRDVQKLTWHDLTTIRNLGCQTLLDIVCVLEMLETTMEEHVRVDHRQTQQVFQAWSNITSIELSAGQASRFHREAAQLFVSGWPEDELQSAGKRIHAIRGRLRLVEWADELAHPGTVVVATAASRWADATDEEAETVRQALTDLLTHDTDDRDFEIISQSYGLAGADTRTLADIGIFVGLSGERVRQLRDKILRRSLARTDDSPLWRALINTLRALVADGGHDGMNIIRTALAILPATPVRTSVDLVARLLGTSREERDRLRKSLRAELRKAARRQREEPTRRFRLEQLQSAAATRFESLRADAYWPVPLADRPIEIPVPLRLLDGDLPPYVFSSAKMAREIAAESSIELRFYQLCETATEVTWYCEQPAAIEYYFDGRWRQYFPDAMVAFKDGTRLLVEIKNLMESSLTMNQAKWAAARSWCTERGIGFLVTDGSRTLRSVEEHQPDPEHVQILSDYLKAGTMTWLDQLDLRREVGFSPLDLTATIVQQGWDHRLAPWRLSLSQSVPRHTQHQALTAEPLNQTPDPAATKP
ncbi:TnsA endonuclease N-terminal domain-containing protein [Kribbella sp. CA-293567]|uniref:TnsA endonuclease N-terminal domain-containing protein n=1 Tax=Kribbella sp. CA-293567 TaxID=3002436 RepID=UPI0022DDC826|nr:TnsA endonuclease N-terminal domain-containing protein [Kribbella sp. CA-293567]WBQ04449.1 hypothetical protein OX958_31360 [Kribbella sp. CA-293567]